MLQCLCTGLAPWEIGLWGLRPHLWYDPSQVCATSSPKQERDGAWPEVSSKRRAPCKGCMATSYSPPRANHGGGACAVWMHEQDSS